MTKAGTLRLLTKGAATVGRELCVFGLACGLALWISDIKININIKKNTRNKNTGPCAMWLFCLVPGAKHQPPEVEVEVGAAGRRRVFQSNSRKSKSIEQSKSKVEIDPVATASTSDHISEH